MAGHGAGRGFLGALSVVVAGAGAAPGAAQVCTTAAIPPDSLLIETLARLVAISGERCTVPGDACETLINAATVDGACLTNVNLVNNGGGSWTAGYSCACSFAKANASGSMRGSGTLSTLGTFAPGATLTYSLDRPVGVEIVDCNYHPETTFGVLSSLSFTVYVTNDTVNIADPPGLQHGLLITSLSGTMAGAIVCGQDWGVSFFTLDTAGLPLALGLGSTATGDIALPVNMKVKVTNDVYGAGSPLALYGFIGGHVDVGISNGLTFTLGLNPALNVSPADLNVDGVVNVVDLLALLGHWGPCANCPPACSGDINGDCTVNVVDFLALLGAWTAP